MADLDENKGSKKKAGLDEGDKMAIFNFTMPGDNLF